MLFLGLGYPAKTQLPTNSFPGEKIGITRRDYAGERKLVAIEEWMDLGSHARRAQSCPDLFWQLHIGLSGKCLIKTRLDAYRGVTSVVGGPLDRGFAGN